MSAFTTFRKMDYLGVPEPHPLHSLPLLPARTSVDFLLRPKRVLFGAP